MNREKPSPDRSRHDDDPASSARIERQILDLVEARGRGRTICPSEVARALEADEDAWRRLMKPVRRAAIRLAEDGRIEILKKGKRIEPDNVRGVVRLRISPDTPS